MLTYLIATAILNLLLGYALAVYFMRASRAVEFAQQSMEALRRFPRSSSNNEGSDSAFPLERSLDANEASAAPEATAETSARKGLCQSSEETDAQILAGIADFRTQLAKLRSSTTLEQEASGDEALAPLARRG